MTRTRTVAPVGVLGGTFDPVHLGHLRLASEVRSGLRLSRLVLLPAAIPPHKRAEELGPLPDRTAMIRLALQDWPEFELSTLELDTNRVCYTIDSLRALRDGTPRCAPVFLLGLDALADLTSWRDWRALLAEFDLAVVDREDRPATRARLAPEIVERLVPVPPDGCNPAAAPSGGRVFHLQIETLPISSREIRRRAAAGEDLNGLVPFRVAEYIQRTGLYRRRDPT